MAEEIEPRAELMAPYLHPYRSFVPVVWEAVNLRRTAAIGGGLAGAGVVAWAATGSAVWAYLAVVVALLTLAAAARWTLEGALVVRRYCRAWDQPHELATVRARRPHAGEQDPALAHDEYAVTVESDGLLYIWRFTPLLATADAPPGRVLVPGRPRYAAEVVEDRPFDPDAASAAEQLAETQARAAALEERAREEAAVAHQQALERRELARETSSTAAALQRITGQSD